MKHYIIVKFKDDLSEEKKENIVREAEELFAELKGQYGIKNVNLKKNCTPRSNRYDLMIIIDMPVESLEKYDNSPEHKKWKADYGSFIEKKAIFDCEDDWERSVQPKYVAYFGKL